MAKTIVVTGASSGIGRALAIHLASLNHQVIAIGRRKELLDDLRNHHPSIQPLCADITKAEDQSKIKNLLSNHNSIYLVHSAGFGNPCMIDSLSEADWDQHYAVNIKAPFFLTKALLNNLKNGGRVLQISTGLAHYALPGFVAYGTSKAAFYLAKEYFNSEFNDDGIWFASASPGTVDTPMQEKIRSMKIQDLPAIKQFKDYFNNGELLKPETVAKFLSWLLLEVDNQKFIKDEWKIYDTTHHKYWANPQEVIQHK